MSTLVLVLPSPLLPSQVYEPLLHALSTYGADATLAPSTLDSDEDSNELVRRWSALALPGHILVAHSNAGYLAPSVRYRSRAAGVVFMDAALPPASGDAALAPPGFREHLGRLALEDGTLPPWTRWWQREELDDVIPRGRFDDIDSHCPRLPLHYFDGRVTNPVGWTRGRSAYLAFGSTYAAEVEFARAQDWPLDTIDGGHLHFMNEPATVADRLLDLASTIVGVTRTD